MGGELPARASLAARCSCFDAAARMLVEERRQVHALAGSGREEKTSEIVGQQCLLFVAACPWLSQPPCDVRVAFSLSLRC